MPLQEPAKKLGSNQFYKYTHNRYLYRRGYFILQHINTQIPMHMSVYTSMFGMFWRRENVPILDRWVQPTTICIECIINKGNSNHADGWDYGNVAREIFDREKKIRCKCTYMCMTVIVVVSGSFAWAQCFNMETY